MAICLDNQYRPLASLSCLGVFISTANAIERGGNRQLAECPREIYRRAMTDADFRETALNDPEAAFEAVGGSLKNWSVRVVDSEKGVDDVFMLPSSVETAAELTKDELDAVVGGATDSRGCCRDVTARELEVMYASY